MADLHTALNSARESFETAYKQLLRAVRGLDGHQHKTLRPDQDIQLAILRQRDGALRQGVPSAQRSVFQPEGFELELHVDSLGLRTRIPDDQECVLAGMIAEAALCVRCRESYSGG
jgi:hypothetical protein